jgi:hypothetical protein
MAWRRAEFNVFLVAATLTVPLALTVEIGTFAAGRELRWFGKLTQIQSAWLRYSLLAVATASIVCAIAFRERRTEA